MDSNRNRLALVALIHVAIWLIIMQLIFDVFGLLDSLFSLLEGGEFVDEAFIIIPTIVTLFYWNSNFLVPRYLSRKSWWKYVIGLLVSFIVLLHIGYFVHELLYETGYETGFYDSDDFFDFSLTLHLLAVGISTSLGLSNLVVDKEKQKQEAERLQRESELKFLNAQINPHFIYNTLNGLYALALEEKAEKTIESILQLSEVLRYPLNNASVKSVSLLDEVNFVDKFINLQRIRLGEEYPITFVKKGSFNDIKIAPFLVIPIVENAFKYGVSLQYNSPIYFALERVGEGLVFMSKNKKVTSEKVMSHLVGIRNLEDRLDLIYSGKYTLEITESEEDYCIELSVDNTGD